MVLPASAGLGAAPGGAAGTPVATPVFHWDFDATSQVMADPGAGKLRVDHPTSLTSVANIAISATTERGVAALAWLTSLKILDKLFFIQLDDDTKHFVCQVHTFGVADNGTWFQISVLPLSSGAGGMFDDLGDLGTEFTILPAAAAATDYIWSFTGTLNTAQNNLIPILVKETAESINELEAHVVEAPTGADAIFELVINGTPTGDTVTIPAGSTEASQAITPVAVSADDDVQMRINQVGSTIPGTTVTMIARVA